MTNAEALKRANAALLKAARDSDWFEGASMGSGDIVDIIQKALRAEFAKPS